MNIKQTVYQDGNIGCLVFLPGRNGHSSDLKQFYTIKDFKMIGFDAQEKEWYSKPNGIKDQTEAISSLEKNRKIIQAEIEKIEMPKNRIALIGFSAGGVAAVWTAINDKEEYAIAMAHSGAILDLNNIPPPPKFNKMSIIMAHGKEDDVFGYEERFIPSIEALRKKGYTVGKITNPKGKHTIELDDAETIEALLYNKLFVFNSFK